MKFLLGWPVIRGELLVSGSVYLNPSFKFQSKSFLVLLLQFLLPSLGLIIFFFKFYFFEKNLGEIGLGVLGIL